MFRRLMLYLVSTSFVTVLLSIILFYFFGRDVYGRKVLDDLMPRAVSIASITSRYLEGKISYDAFNGFINNDLRRGSRVYVFDNQGNLFAGSNMRSDDAYLDRRRDWDDTHYFSKYVNETLSTGKVVSETNQRGKTGSLVCVPVTDNIKRVCGAVVVTKPPEQITENMLSILSALAASCIIVSVLTMTLAYFGSKRITGPLNQMKDISKKMAAGDFSENADETAGGELGELGKALNDLSQALSETISELTSTKNRLSMILDGMKEAVVLTDITCSTVSYMNPSARVLLGNKNLSDFIAESSEEASFDRFSEKCRELNESGAAGSFVLKRNDTVYEIVISASEPNGEFILLIRDITEQENLEQTRKDYVANVSHELRTPIASIRSLAETLNDGMVKNEDDKKRYYGYILRESMRLSRLINDLLELSRIQSGAVALRKEVFSVSDMLNETCERIRINAEYSGLEFEYTPVKVSDAFSNRDRIEQVVIALSDNAIKYATDNGRVAVAAFEDEKRVYITIRNTGYIDECDLPHIFDRFYKADKSHTGMGTGLGLSIANEIMHLLGESIAVKNEGDEVVFTISITKASFD